MKNILFTVPCALLFITLAGCGGSSNSDQGPEINLLSAMEDCTSCHIDTNVGVIDPGVVAAADGTTYPDTFNLSNSKICLTCHDGGSSASDIINISDFANASFVATQDLPSAGILFQKTGYKYDVDGDPQTDNYSYLSNFKHTTVGTSDSLGAEVWAGTGISGPCVSCHLKGVDSHIFSALSVDEFGSLTLPSVCSSCHNTTDPAGSHFFSVDTLLEDKQGYNQAVEMLGSALADVGHPYLGSTPYFSQGDWTNMGAYDGQKLLGAAFNFNILKHEAGAYAHNSYFAKRLIFDSLDYIDNGTLDGIITIDEVTYHNAARWFGWDGVSAGFSVSRP